ncbi:hypothetical protein BDW42DRAFT_160048 [Aspergillus taichungensis]|uniref:Uncharacterized protein n=1 Tax=Aspergillus taichungensis TaxID=482145 RepID=A0A2J5I7D6_9EURO|nr:hypothetical protein BDW42DRAFT_160048 [Aspergillus taichungensis]
MSDRLQPSIHLPGESRVSINSFSLRQHIHQSLVYIYTCFLPPPPIATGLGRTSR